MKRYTAVVQGPQFERWTVEAPSREAAWAEVRRLHPNLRSASLEEQR